MVYGGHDKKLHLMNTQREKLDEINFDGWVRCSFPVDLNNDGCDEILVGAGDGSLLAVRFEKEQNKLIGIMHYKSTGKVNCCTSGDLYRNGNKELIFGGENKTLKILKDTNSEEPIETLYYDSWIMACALGTLKLPKAPNPIYALLVGTKNGLLQLIQIKDNKPDVLWDRNVYAPINAIKIGDVTNDGENEIIVATEDGFVKIFDAIGSRIKYIQIEESRPVSIIIDDIDGDNSNEIVVGCANGSLKVYHNLKLQSDSFELKWKAKVKSSIKDVLSYNSKEDNIKHIIFGGYDRSLRDVSDFEWGQKPPLEIPKSIKLPEIPPVKPTFKAVPTNINEYINKLLEEKGFVLTLELLTKELIDMGYTRDVIEEEFGNMKSQKALIYEKINIPVWSLPGAGVAAEVSDVKVEPTPPITEKPAAVEKPAVVVTPPSAGSITDVIVEFLKEKKVVGTKPAFVKGIIEKGFSKAEVDSEINSLKGQGIIKYSRSAPKGWSLTSETPAAVKAAPAKKAPAKKKPAKKAPAKKKPAKKAPVKAAAASTADTSEMGGKILDYLKEKELVGTKAAFVNDIIAMGFSKADVDKQIEVLKKENKIKYSRSAPRGWSLA
jgi:hypothetical protein